MLQEPHECLKFPNFNSSVRYAAERGGLKLVIPAEGFVQPEHVRYVQQGWICLVLG